MKFHLALGLCLLAGAVQAQGTNPWIAVSPYPMSHHDSHASDTTGIAGPVAASQLGAPSYTDTGLTGLINITLASSTRYPDGQYAYWGSNINSVYKVLTAGGKVQKVAQLSKPYNSLTGILKAPTSGAYTLVDLNNVFYTVQGTHILAYADQNPASSSSPIRLLREYTLPAAVADSSDAIVGLNMTWDGRLAFVTKTGVVGVIDRYFTSLSSLRLLPGETVSNSISTDASGGIYAVTDKRQYRVQWTGSKVSLDERDGAWMAEYRTGPARPISLGAGSGSTPTIMGEGSQQFVVITDGAKVANLVLFWKDAIPADWQPIAPGRDRRIAAEMPVNFGDPDRAETVTEQSVVVNGYGAAVVSNDIQHADQLPPATGFAPLDNLIAGFPSAKSALAAFFGGSPYFQPWGVQKFQWDVATRKLVSSWSNLKVSCPNSIPMASSASNTFYCVGARSGLWTIEALNWTTGELRFSKPLGNLVTGRLPRFNSFYATTEMTAEGGLLYGSLTGVVYIPKL